MVRDLQAIFARGTGLSYHSPKFKRPSDFKPESEEWVEQMIQVPSDVWPLPAGQQPGLQSYTKMIKVCDYWDAIKGEWNACYGKKANKVIDNTGAMFKDKRLMKFIREYCKDTLVNNAMPGKQGFLPEVEHAYLTMGEDVRCEDLESLVIEHLWRYAKEVKHTEGKYKGEYILAYYRRNLDQQWWPQLQDRAGKRNREYQHGLEYIEGYTESKVVKNENGRQTRAEYGSADRLSDEAYTDSAFQSANSADKGKNNRPQVTENEKGEIFIKTLPIRL